MKNLTYVFLVLGIIAIAAGVIGLSVNGQGPESLMFGNGAPGVYELSENEGYDGYYGMMGDRGRYSFFGESAGNGEKLSLEVLVEKAEAYISRYNEELSIGDIFIYEDSEYYFSIIEEGTGRGAMELLVNPYTGVVFPEFGPNMMWNIKYGMHSRSSGMMGRFYTGFSGSRVYSDNEISSKEAYDIGNEYVKANVSDKAKISNEPHEFYGYYTFHIEDSEETVGMLSINGSTGEVWFHDWHGELLEIISGHKGEAR